LGTSCPQRFHCYGPKCWSLGKGGQKYGQTNRKIQLTKKLDFAQHPNAIGTSYTGSGKIRFDKGKINPICQEVVLEPVRREKSNWVKVDALDLLIHVQDGPCKHSRVMQEILRIGVSKVVSFHRCAMNEYNSIVNRHVKTQLPCTEAATKLMFNSINSLLYDMRFVDLSPMTIGSVIESRPQRMRKRYKNVMSQSPDPGMGKSFIKFEKLEDKDNLIPRLIQYRSSAYTLQLARYTI